MWYERTKELTLRLVQSPSISETREELVFADILEALLREIPYWQENPDLVWSQPIAHDPLGRKNVYALVRGDGKQTTVLSGHYDVVGVQNYGSLADFAFDPVHLTERLIQQLQSRSRSEAEERALTDLMSGDFMAGRGMLDMKSGLAAALCVMEQFSYLSERKGNLLFVAVADEEVSSHGARSAASELAGIAQRHDLELLGVINLDATGDHTDGSLGRALYTGTIGKLMLSALVVGIDTHAGYSLDGINANFIASGLVRSLEWNPQLTDKSRGIIGTPSTILRQRDLKDAYDVTTPQYAWVCVNVLPHGWSAQEVMQRYRVVAEESLQESLDLLQARGQSFASYSNVISGLSSRVMTYAELSEYIRKKDPFFDQAQQEFADTLSGDYLTQSAQLTRWTWERSGLGGVAIILGYASVHYPSTTLTEPNELHFLECIQTALKEAAQDPSEIVCKRPIFTGISDMSWFGRTDTDLCAVNQNTPIAAAHIHSPPAGLPCVNLGPWGRDYHQWLERVHQPYSFGMLPRLLWSAIERLHQ